MNTKELVSQLGDIPELKDYSEPLQKAVRTAIQGPLKDLLHGVWLGHPLHPVLTDIPVGAWTLAQVLDAIGADDAADIAIGVGLVGALGSAVTGLADWSETDDRARNIGLVHGILNVIATGLYTTSLVLRKQKGSRKSGVTLAMIGYATAFASAYLGGHLVFGEQIGVDHTATADQKKPEKYTRAMKVDELKNEKPTKCVIDGVSILLFKRDDEIYAITETCPHLGGPLSEGKVVNGAIQCPWHGSQLALDDGHVVSGPTAYPARCFDVRVRGGYIEVRAARD